MNIFSEGQKIEASKVNENFEEVSGIKKAFIAGETINGDTLPVPVYQDSVSGKVFACDANVSTKTKFIGFAITNAVLDGEIIVQVGGIVGGFTGLSFDTPYYIQNTAGTIGATASTNEVLPIGIAKSATEIAIKTERRVYKKIVSSTSVIQLSAPTQRSTTSSSQVLVKEFLLVDRAGSLRVYFDGYITGASTPVNMYINGVLAKTRNIVNGSYTTYNDEITGIPAFAHIEIKWSTSSGTAYMRNFYLKFTEEAIDEVKKVLTD